MSAIELMLLTGEYLLYLLAFILMVRPLVKFNRRFSPLFKYRKQMGWAFGGLTLIHIAIYLLLYVDDLRFILTLFNDLWFIAGLIATVLTLALTATSNRKAQRKLKTHWKTLHKATYYIGFLGILHGEIASKQINYTLYVMLIIYALLVLYRYRNTFGIAVVSISLFVTYQVTAPVFLPTPAVSQVVTDSPLAFERCGQYGLDYFEINGFYDCLVRSK